MNISLLPYKSIYDLNDLTSQEEEFAHANADIRDMRYKKELDATKFRRTFWRKVFPKFIYIRLDNKFGDIITEKIKAPITKEEYFEATTQIERYNHLFYIFMMRGNFTMAKQYELISNKDFIQDFENIPQDVFMKNEMEYYAWLKDNIDHNK